MLTKFVDALTASFGNDGNNYSPSRPQYGVKFTKRSDGVIFVEDTKTGWLTKFPCNWTEWILRDRAKLKIKVTATDPKVVLIETKTLNIIVDWSPLYEMNTEAEAEAFIHNTFVDICSKITINSVESTWEVFL